MKLTGVAGSTPVSFAGFKASAPEISPANPGQFIADTGGTPANQGATTATGPGSPASFPVGKKSKIGYELSGSIAGERSYFLGIALVESTSQADATVGLSKVEVFGYKIVRKLPAFTKP